MEKNIYIYKTDVNLYCSFTILSKKPFNMPTYLNCIFIYNNIDLLIHTICFGNLNKHFYDIQINIILHKQAMQTQTFSSKVHILIVFLVFKSILISFDFMILKKADNIIFIIKLKNTNVSTNSIFSINAH